MDSRLWALVLFCWILIAGVLTGLDSSPTHLFDISGNRSLRRSSHRNVDPDEEDFKLTEFVVMKHYLALASWNLLEMQEVQSQKGNMDNQMELQDSYVQIGNDDIFLTKLKWGEHSDLIASLQSCLTDFGLHLTTPIRLQMSFRFNFTRNLSVYGKAEKFFITNGEDDFEHLPKKQSNPSIGVTDEPSISEQDQWVDFPTKFVITIQNATLGVNYTRLLTLSHGIISEAISEEVNFLRMTVENEVLHRRDLIVDDQFKNVEDKMVILQKLADSWMVSLINNINNRYIRPNMLELSQSLFQVHKGEVLSRIGDLILQTVKENSNLWQGKPIETADKSLASYPIDQLELRDFEHFHHFTPFSSTDLVLENGTCQLNEVYCHTLIFDYYLMPMDTSKFNLPSIVWHHIEQVQSEKSSQKPKFIQPPSDYLVTVVSIKLIINTDKFGKAISTEVETHVPLEEEEYSHRVAAVLKIAEKLISDRVKEKITSNM